MKVVFLSNFYNHHQAPFSEEMWRLTEGNYTFIETTPMDPERIALGYQQFRTPFLLQYASEPDECGRRIQEADVIFVGSAPRKLIRGQLKKGKLVLFYSERIYRTLPKWYEMPARAVKYYLEKGRYKNMYLLCSSAFTAADYARTGTFLHRTYQWGYFPEAKRYQPEVLMEKKDRRRILWVGRFLKLKHADDALTAAKRLKDAGYNFSMELCGMGEMETQLKEQARQMKITDCVAFVGAVSSDRVRAYMERAGIFLFTSDRYEGWGAVLNESMNSGCAVVASHAIGSVPYLMKHNQNGLIYHSENVDELYENVKYLLDHPKEQERLGRAAYETITGEWNAGIAAERVLNLSSHLLSGKAYPDLYQTGPCARAECIRDEWF